MRATLRWAAMAVSGTQREALSLRGVERAFGINRRRLAEAVEAGELRAARVGKRKLTILRTDVERWLRGAAVTSKPAAPDPALISFLDALAAAIAVGVLRELRTTGVAPSERPDDMRMRLREARR